MSMQLGVCTVPTAAAIAALAPTGVLRAAINMSNFLLVTGRDADGSPTGVSPDVARELARRLGVPITLLAYPSPGDLAAAADTGVWDIGNIGAEPQRAETIAFTAAYSEIECTYLVPSGSPLWSIDAVDQPGVRIASAPLAAFDLWLERNLKSAELVRASNLAGAFDLFVTEKLDALAGLRPGLIRSAEKLPGSRILDGKFTSVQQAIGTPTGRDEAGIAYLRTFVADVIASGFVAERITAHGVVGLSVSKGTSA